MKLIKIHEEVWEKGSFTVKERYLNPIQIISISDYLDSTGKRKAKSEIMIGSYTTYLIESVNDIQNLLNNE